MWLAGFDRLTPEADALIAALRERGTHVEQAPAGTSADDVRILACEDPDAELRTAGAWARSQLDRDPQARVAIVVSGLEQEADRAGRQVREGFVPGWQYAPGRQRESANISFGRRLQDYPAIEVALLLLRWTHSAIAGRDVSLLLRSPFLGLADTDGRARLELELRRMPDREWTPELLLPALGGREQAVDASDWLARLAILAETVRSRRQEASPAEWAAVIDGLLDDFGWPGAAPLESADFQLVNRWRDLLNELAKLELVMPQTNLGHAVGQLRAMAADTVFQPEREGAVVEVLGPLEAAGMEFEQLWVAGLTASQWPPPGRPMALISRRLQRHYGMPDADPDDTAAYAKRVIDRLLASAGSWVGSYPCRSGDAVETRTALLGDVAESHAPDDPGWHARQLCDRAAARILHDDPVPAVSPGESLAAGAAVVQWQMTEPFSAFALARLGVSALQPIAPGLSSILRGNLIHTAAFHLYAERPSQADIRDWLEEEIAHRIDTAVNRAFPRYERYADGVLKALFALERQRVSRLLHELVDVDRQRERFSVQDVERSMQIDLGAVRLRLRIDRIDRFDDGAVAILDYKTGVRRKFLDGSGEPVDAQLLVYAFAVEEPVAALGFYNIDSRETSLDASGRDAMGAENWQLSLERWQQAVAAAAAGFAAGDVRIRYRQALREARSLNILSRYGEIRRDA